MDRESADEPRFSQDEMSEILELAARLDGPLANPDELSYDELTQVAAELGISEDAVREVLARKEREAESARRQEAAAERARADRSDRWRDVWSTVARMVPIAVFFLLIDLVTGDGLSWWYWPVIGLTIPVITAVMNAIVPGADENGDR